MCVSALLHKLLICKYTPVYYLHIPLHTTYYTSILLRTTFALPCILPTTLVKCCTLLTTLIYCFILPSHSLEYYLLPQYTAAYYLHISLHTIVYCCILPSHIHAYYPSILPRTCEKSEESLRQQKMVARISTSSRGGWSHATVMLWMQNLMQPFLWTKLMTSPLRLRLEGRKGVKY